MPLEVRCAPLSQTDPPPTPSPPPTPAYTPPDSSWDPTGPCARLSHWPMGLWVLAHTDTRTPSLRVIVTVVTVVIIISQGPQPQDPMETCLICNLPAAAAQHCYLTPAQARKHRTPRHARPCTKTPLRSDLMFRCQTHFTTWLSL